MSVPGRISVVLHTHMPYVEGFGTWPFGEEWLWEAVATSYLPVLDLLDGGVPLTLSLTPVLCDQLEAPGALDRCAAFLRDVRPASHELDAVAFRAAGEPALAAEIERAAGQYASALAALERCSPGGLLARMAPHAAWTSSATHAILPLLATDAGTRLQVRTGVAGHRTRFGEDAWRGGFWLPECAHEPWVDRLLAQEGVRAACVELPRLTAAVGPPPLLRSADGPLLVPIDRPLIDLVWGAGGYPGRAAYRDEHRRTARDHRPWANDGSVYDPQRALAQVEADAQEFAQACAARVAAGGLSVLAFDTELFGHHWHEGPAFLRAFAQTCAQRGVALTPLDDALDALEGEAQPWPADADVPTSWGAGGDLRTWSGPQVADIARALRRAEIEVVHRAATAPDRALRELLALQASDWAFLETFGRAGPYARERSAGHLAALKQALSAVGSPDSQLRHLAPHLRRAAVLEP
ncbi:unannotated protein [freshwater metagenome]|uniref:Unannotated protein n=1 Tax=freshwater metagenome TaxID=449393 RepID=A0A6J7IXD0_9ZZZZ|nr:DUF1957 domain-containing protein [Actinomycetota bacterium]